MSMMDPNVPHTPNLPHNPSLSTCTCAHVIQHTYTYHVRPKSFRTTSRDICTTSSKTLSRMEDVFIDEMEISLGDISIEDLDDNTPNYAQFETALNAELQSKSFDESNEGDVLASILEQTELESIPIPKTKDELNRDPDLPAKYSSQELDYSYRTKDRWERHLG